MKELGPEQYTTLVGKDISSPEQSFVHYLCDPNIPMYEAFQTVVGREVNLQDNDDLALLDMAWNLATSWNFIPPVKTKPPEQGEPIPDHGKTLHLSFYQEMFDENNAAQG